MSTEKVNLASLLSTCVNLSRASECIIRDVLLGGDLGTVDKAEKPGDDFDPQTAADTGAQRLIVSQLHKAFPSVKVIGEEGELEPDESARGYSESDIDEVAAVPDEDIPEDIRMCDSDKLVVWVDPLDGTTEFTHGRLEAVTTLIGIAYEGRPIAGVVHQPFQSETKGRSLYGVVGPRGLRCNGTLYGFTSDELSRSSTKRDQSPLTPVTKSFSVVTSRSHMSDSLKALVARLSPTEEVRVGGAGNKVIQVLIGAADAYFYPQNGTKRWDTCAPEALVIAAGGMVTDKDGKEYDYAADIGDPVNANGVLVAMRQDHIDHMVAVTGSSDIMRTLNGDTLEASMIQTSLESSGVNTDGCKIVGVIGDPNTIIRGRHSHTLRAHLRWSPRVPTDAPKSVYVKRIDPRNMEERPAVKWSRDITSYVNEFKVYELYRHLAKNGKDGEVCDLGSHSPVAYYADSQIGYVEKEKEGGEDASKLYDPTRCRFLLVLRDYPSSEQVLFMDDSHTRGAIDALAKQHACFWNAPALSVNSTTKKAGADEIGTGCYWTRSKRPPGELETVPGMWEKFLDSLRSDPETPADIVEAGRYDSIGKDLTAINDDVEDAIRADLESGEMITLVHGDCKTGNLLFSKESVTIDVDTDVDSVSTNGGDTESASTKRRKISSSSSSSVEMTPAALIDFQWTGRGVPGMDLSYLGHSSLAEGISIDDMVPFYCSRLKAHGGPAVSPEIIRRQIDTATLSYATVVIAYMWGKNSPDTIRANAPVLARCTHNRSMTHVYSLVRTIGKTLKRWKR